MLSTNSITVLTLIVTIIGASRAHPGPCSEALVATQNSSANYAELKTYPIVCNWNFLFAIEGKMIEFGDLDSRRSAAEFHDPIDPTALKLAQRRVGLPETGILDEELFWRYMQLD